MTIRPATSVCAAAPACALLLAACSQIPPYEVPATPDAAHYAEPLPGWMAAAPADTLARAPWWQLFADPQLDSLASRVAVSNQTVASAQAAVEESRALLREQRSAWFPTVGLTAGASRSGRGGASGTTSTGTSADNARAGNVFSLGLGASWEPDVWGRVSAGVSSAEAGAQASAADLASATLSAQGTFVVDYLSAREADAEIAIFKSTIEGYRRALQITQNRYAAAIAQKSDVLQAQTTLANAQADLAALVQTRAQVAHAMAVLVGETPATFALPAGTWNADAVPAIPVGIPSELLQRRPDIASAERHVAAANAQVGVARSAWFPSITLSASAGQDAARLGDLFDASATTWSFGLALAETLFDAGLRSAQVAAARAAWSATVADYRQTVLTAFQGVEDQLSAADSLQQQQALRRDASEAADQTEQQMLNRYREGIVAYTDVVTAQATALSARRSLLQITLSRQTAAVQMIEALGGGWTTRQLADSTTAP
jgi:NodT family efflux transporter outer membrane factor (OMF) lipoprotein